MHESKMLSAMALVLVCMWAIPAILGGARVQAAGESEEASQNGRYLFVWKNGTNTPVLSVAPGAAFKIKQAV